MDKNDVILAVDPGTRVTGYGVVGKNNEACVALDYGCIKPPPSLKLSERYLIIFEGIEELIVKYCPSVIIVETQYVKHNIRSALTLGMARGAVMIAAKRNGLPIFGYAPAVAKRAVSGYGRASKKQVQEMVKCVLNLTVLPEPEDAADALALAICHAHHPEHFKAKNEI